MSKEGKFGVIHEDGDLGGMFDPVDQETQKRLVKEAADAEKKEKTNPK